MALKDSDKKLVVTTAKALRAKEAISNSYQLLYPAEQFGEGDDADFVSNRELTSVVITKEDLRENSGRKHVRESYQKEIVAELNWQTGVSAELRDGNIYAKAVPVDDVKQASISLSRLIKEGDEARSRLLNDNEDE